MNTRRTYLDTLNTGRQRKSEASLEQLSRSLEHLELQLDRREKGRAPAAAPISRAAPPSSVYQPRVEIREPAPAPKREPAYGRTDPHGPIDSISSDMRALREEMRQHMGAGLRREFESLRSELEQSAAAIQGRSSQQISLDLERLADSVQSSMAGRNDDKALNVLRLELEQVKNSINSLAREDTVRSVGARWDDIDRKLAALQTNLGSGPAAIDIDPAFAALNERLDQIGMTVRQLPESLSFDRVEEKIRNLASAIDHFSRQQEAGGQSSMAAIEDRLEEISRAIVATSMSPAQSFDAKPFERIETRLNALARQLDEAEGPRGEELMDRLNALAHRVEDIASASSMPDQAIDTLSRQMALLADKVSASVAAPGLDNGVLGEIEQRLADMTNRLDRAPAATSSMAEEALEALSRQISKLADKVSAPAVSDSRLLQDIEQRLAEVTMRLDQPTTAHSGFHDEAYETLSRQIAKLSEKISAPVAAAADNGLLQDIEQRLAEVALRLDRAPAAASSSIHDDALEMLSRQIADLADRVSAPAIHNNVNGEVLQDIEQRLAQVAGRLDQAPIGSASDEAIFAMQKRLDFLAKKMETGIRGADVDPGLMQSLESQLGALSGFLGSGADIAPRLDRLEATLMDNKAEIVQAAREAAEYAVRGLAVSSGDSSAVAGLTQDLKVLEDLTRRSDDRNSKTFEAIHDTLIKIVDRLGSIETAPARMSAPAAAATAAAAMAAAEAPRVFGKADTPSLDVDDYDQPELRVAPRPAAAGHMSPAQAAAAAAAAALSDLESGTGPHSMQYAAASTAHQAPEIALDMPLDPAAANLPLEPGSRPADLNFIMNRVREDRDGAGRNGDAEAARSDFIAAARRAAQAAAAEAEVLKRNSEPGAGKGGGKFKFLDMLRARKKPLIMATAAIVVALIGMQLGGSLLKDPKPVLEQARIEQPATPELAAEEIVEAPSQVRVVGKETGSTTSQSAASAVAPELEEPDEIVEARPEAAPELSEPVDVAAPADVAPADTETVAEVVPAAAKTAGKTAVPTNAGPQPLREAAEEGNPKALFEIGSRFGEGRGVKADLSAASKWYEQSADLGFAPAQYRIGNMYEKGTGVKVDIKKAKNFYQLAANQGNASAMHNLAVLFATEQDNDSAARWFQKAAALGVKDSQFNLGILSARGYGVPQNMEESYKWFALVAKTGDRDASQKRDEIANILRPEQLKAAKAQVDLWKPEPMNAEANSLEVPESWRESQTQTASVDMKKAIRNVQALLNKAGYDAGPADGQMGEKTKQAIARFQKEKGIDATGEINEKTVNALLDKK